MSPDDAWKIPAGAERCARCDAELQPGQQVTTVLRLGADGPGRDDLCARCGESVEEGADAFFWRRPLAEAGEHRPVVDYGLLRGVFERLLTREETVYRRLAYLVGLVLIRKRYLRLIGFERRDGREVMVVRRAAGEPERVVPAPFLSAEAMVETREHLGRLLAADLPEGDLPTELGVPEPGAAEAADHDEAPDQQEAPATGAAEQEATADRPRPELN